MDATDAAKGLLAAAARSSREPSDILKPMKWVKVRL